MSSGRPAQSETPCERAPAPARESSRSGRGGAQKALSGAGRFTEAAEGQRGGRALARSRFLCSTRSKASLEGACLRATSESSSAGPPPAGGGIAITAEEGT